jgi:predicted nucleic acid-binding protein
MLGVDTNVLVRYLTRDDQPQFDRARRLNNREVAKGDPVLVSLWRRSGYCDAVTK